MRTVITFIAALVSVSFSLAAAAIEVPDSAFDVGAVDEGEPRAETRLIVDHATVTPGQAFRIGVLFDLDPEWHVYGEDPGDAGLPTSIIFRSDDASFGTLQWPPTQTFVDPSGRIETTGYAPRVVVPAEATVTSTDDGELKLTAEVDYLACRVKCLPGNSVLTRTVRISETPTAAEDEVVALFDRFEAADPPAPANTTIDQTTPTENPSPATPSLPLWQTLLFAFLGGLLLNLMPCVFPVLALKVYGFVTTGSDRAHALRHAGAYAAGILASMALLAGAVLALKWTGSKVGWGFQFQDPTYLSVLTILVTLFALNLFGVFSVPLLPVPSQAGGTPTTSRSFVDGIFAVVLATPCSAPFLGTAVGFALAASDLTIALTFVSIGVGLAAPFVVASAIPAVAGLLPRPGAWMEVFERVLGFLLLGTSVWLVWVYGRVAGADGIGRLLAAILAGALGVWIWGQLQFADSKKKLGGGLAALGLIVGGFLFFAPHTAEPVEPASGANVTDDWTPYDRDAVAPLQAEGKVVFVDFTADWCLTCKVNENTVLATAEVRSRLHAEDVVAMKADWTRRDERIRAELARYGRAGVPLYLVFPAGGGDAEVLPEVLTPGLVLDAISRATR